MKIYIIERDFEKYKYLIPYFSDIKDVILINDDIIHFLKNNSVECVVSPANSFGIMDGGYDYYLTKYYGKQLQRRVQQYIIKNYYGEQPVGTSFIIPTNKDNQFLIHTPTMRTPSKILDNSLIYQCTRATLIVAKKNGIKSIVLPMFGGATGCVKPQVAAELMRLAFEQLNDLPKKIDWDYAYKLDSYIEKNRK